MKPISLLVLAGAFALAACSTAPPPTVAPTALTGTLTLAATLDFRGDPIGRQPFAFGASSTECVGAGGYDDVRANAPVVLKDAAGTIIGTAALSIGKATIGPQSSSEVLAGAAGHPTACMFSFRIEKVPDSTFYTVTVAGRDGPTYARADLAAANWTVNLTLGDKP